MTMKWFQLSGGAYNDESGPVFSDATEGRLWEVFPDLEVDVISGFDGARWLLQGGFERVSLGLEFRVEKKGRQLRAVSEIGRLLTVNFSVAWPELESATIDQIKDHLRPIVAEALELAGEKKKLGPLPRHGAGERLAIIPLKPLIEDPMPHADGPGDSFVITRELPPGLSAAEEASVLKQYEDDLERLLSEQAKRDIVEAEISATSVRWVIEVPNSND
ncbi:hypothetical protein GCM10009789_86830 [Kribbella sancticallisti]|uniref:Uncharacterized protein n=2 Tax=Kribbella sancticallisti TaxID=460087 RepID=A0ABN2EWH6_9ACTN